MAEPAAQGPVGSILRPDSAWRPPERRLARHRWLPESSLSPTWGSLSLGRSSEWSPPSLRTGKRSFHWLSPVSPTRSRSCVWVRPTRSRAARWAERIAKGGGLPTRAADAGAEAGHAGADVTVVSPPVTPTRGGRKAAVSESASQTARQGGWARLPTAGPQPSGRAAPQETASCQPWDQHPEGTFEMRRGLGLHASLTKLSHETLMKDIVYQRQENKAPGDGLVQSKPSIRAVAHPDEIVK